MSKVFITGIGTDIGKTIVSAVITEALQADYWKPIQAGLEEETDSQKVRRLVTNKKSIIQPESFRLKMAASPHAAAAAEDISISVDNIKPPITSNLLVIEGAGGLMVPLNDKELVADLIKALGASVVVVIRHYLGSINHSLLTLQVLEQWKIPVAGMVFNGNANKASESIILAHFNYPIIGRVGEEKEFTSEVISGYARQFRESKVLLAIADRK